MTMSSSGVIDQLLNDGEFEKIAEAAIDFSILKGMVFRTREKPHSSEVVHHLPITLVPSPVPKDLFVQALSVQRHFGTLMHRISRDHAFLKESYQSVLDTDSFMRKLFEIYESVHHLNKDRIHFAIMRLDYMFAAGSNSAASLKQIEINTIAVGLCGIGTDAMLSVHKHVLRTKKLNGLLDRLPENTAFEVIANALVAAWRAYKNPNAILVFVVTVEERLIFDHRAIEFKINELDANISIFRYTLHDFVNARMDINSCLFINGREVGLLYFRAGYDPKHYPSDKEWNARLMMEKSRAVKCPSVAYQLVGAKKLQQILAQDGVVEKFIKDPDAVSMIRDTFVKFHGLEMNEQGDAAVSILLAKSDDYVLKPQLEGGGNNFYGKDLVAKLNEVGKDKRRCSYIGMEKIRSMPFKTVLLSREAGPDQYKPIEGVSELGVFGILLVDGDTIVQNQCAGHYLRTKPMHADEGSVSGGIAALDTPLLI